MRMRLGSIIGMILIIGGASFIGRIIKAISLDNYKHDDDHRAYSDEEITEPTILGTDSDHLLWFIQISDLHLSLFHDQTRDYHLRKFCNVTVDIISPLVVLASGDLTDGKDRNGIGSRQYEKEWHSYSSILRSTGVLSKTTWLDIRGNHDNFDVPDLKSDNNFYQHYSIQGQKHPRSYMHVAKKGSDSIAFIAVDACLLPGPKRPFNFIGVLTAEEIDALALLEEESRKYNNTIWFGHYPTSCILSPNPGIREVMGKGLAYLCGHLHDLGGFGKTLYTRQQTGSLELELGDWKDHRLFRVAAIDHGLFSFVDIDHRTWPIILITNPKDAIFNMPENEPLELIAQSTHVRVLVWSLFPLFNVQVKVGDAEWADMQHVEGPLYVAPWDPSKFLKGLHTIEVFAADSKGQRRTASHEFSLDGSQDSFSLMARLILMSNVSLVFQFLFGMSICLAVIPLCVVRCMHLLVLDKRLNRPRIRWGFWRVLLRKLWVVASVNKLFWPLILSALYIPIGPWFIGEILEGHIGVAFSWGIFVYSSYLPGSLTYAYGFLQMAFFHIPVTLLTAHSSDVRYQILFMNETRTFSKFILRHLLFMGVIFIQALNAYFFWLAYGTMAFIMGPLRTWSAFFGIYLWHTSATLQPHDLRSAASVWQHQSSVPSPEASRSFLGEPSHQVFLTCKGKESSPSSNSGSVKDFATEKEAAEPLKASTQQSL